MDSFDDGRVVRLMERTYDVRKRLAARRRRGVSPATERHLRRLAERFGVPEEAIVTLALETLFAAFDSDADLAQAIRRDASSNARRTDGPRRD